ncbi:MAG: MGDG synthase family glycosyltransferase [Spirochaetia bacterium]
MKKTKLKGLIAYLNIGHGFKSPAVAFEKAFAATSAEVKSVDLFAEAGAKKADSFLKKTWQFCLRHPFWFEIIFALNDSPLVHFLQRRQGKSIKKKLLAYIDKEDPDFILCTHFTALEALTTVLKKERPDIKIFGYNSDVILSHEAYVNLDVLQYYVATKSGYEEMINGRMPKELVTLTSFPLHDKFYKEFGTIKQEREKLGLKDKFTLLLTFGGEGIGPVDLLMKITKLNLGIQVVAVCGRNEALKNELEKLKKSFPEFDLVPLGFITNMQDYLYTCDISAGKSGLNMVFESIYLHKPFLTLMAMANERFAAKFVVDHGYGWFPKDQNQILEIIASAANDPEYLKPYIKQLENHPFKFNSADTVASVLQFMEEDHA